MTLPLALVLAFLAVFAILLCAIHRHKCRFCNGSEPLPKDVCDREATPEKRN